jgi:hypothetical protein
MGLLIQRLSGKVSGDGEKGRIAVSSSRRRVFSYYEQVRLMSGRNGDDGVSIPDLRAEGGQ